MLVRLCSKAFKLGFISIWNEKFQMYKLYIKEAEEPEIKLPTVVGSWKKQGNSRKTSISALLTMPKPLTVWITYAVSPSNTLDQPGLVPGTLPWLESNDALALATRMETRLPWRPTRGSLTSPSYVLGLKCLYTDKYTKNFCNNVQRPLAFISCHCRLLTCFVLSGGGSRISLFVLYTLITSKIFTMIHIAYRKTQMNFLANLIYMYVCGYICLH